MEIYASYDFYKNEWKGSLEEAAFSSFVIKAMYEIDRMTFYRITETTDDVKFALCAVIDAMQQIEKYTAEHIGKKAERIGDQSVTYDENMREGSAEYHKTLRSVAYPYLSNTGLLYRGLDYAYKC